jgi:hypothetical protein
LDRGENRVSLTLPLEVMLPIIKYQNENNVGSKRQACCQIVIKFLHDNRFLNDQDFESIKERTKVFREDRDFIEEKVKTHVKEKAVEEQEKMKLRKCQWKIPRPCSKKAVAYAVLSSKNAEVPLCKEHLALSKNATYNHFYK